MRPPTAACESDAEGDGDGHPPDNAEQHVETAVRQCMEFLTTVDSDLSPCLPLRTGWDVLDTAFSAVQARVREMIFSAAQDDLKQWTFKGYVNLVKLTFELITLAGDLGVSSDTLQDLEADLQVRAALEQTMHDLTQDNAYLSVDSCLLLSQL